MTEQVVQGLLVLLGSMVAAGIWSHKRAVLQGNQYLGETIAALTRAVELFGSFQQENTSVHAAMIADLRAIVTMIDSFQERVIPTQQKIQEVQERILRELRDLNNAVKSDG